MTSDHSSKDMHTSASSNQFDPSFQVAQIYTLIKNTFTQSGVAGYVVGVSGGIDSAVVATLLVRAIGVEHVTGLFLPSSSTPKEDIEDVVMLGTWLQMPIHTYPLQPVLAGYQEVITGNRLAFGNLTSRIRMNLLYLYANENNLLVSGTSNKTEWYTGYFTKYGDSAADIQPIIHLFKGDVYVLAQYLELPVQFIKKTPSAGLYEGQTDENDLKMTYVALDAALRSLEQHNWVAESENEKRALVLYQSSSHKRLISPRIH